MGPNLTRIQISCIIRAGLLRAEPGGSLFMRERGKLQRGENPPGRGCTNERFRRLKAPELMKDVYQGAKYVNGVPVNQVPEEKAA